MGGTVKKECIWRMESHRNTNFAKGNVTLSFHQWLKMAISYYMVNRHEKRFAAPGLKMMAKAQESKTSLRKIKTSLFWSWQKLQVHLLAKSWSVKVPNTDWKFSHQSSDFQALNAQRWPEGMHTGMQTSWIRNQQAFLSPTFNRPSLHSSKHCTSSLNFPILMRAVTFEQSCVLPSSLSTAAGEQPRMMCTVLWQLSRKNFGSVWLYSCAVSISSNRSPELSSCPALRRHAVQHSCAVRWSSAWLGLVSAVVRNWERTNRKHLSENHISLFIWTNTLVYCAWRRGMKIRVLWLNPCRLSRTSATKPLVAERTGLKAVHLGLKVNCCFSMVTVWPIPFCAICILTLP